MRHQNVIRVPLTLEVHYSQDLSDYKYLQSEGAYLVSDNTNPIVSQILWKLNDCLEESCQDLLRELAYEDKFTNGND